MTAAIYHPSLYDRQRFHPSYWASNVAAPDYGSLSGDRQVEVAIIGGGYTGLSTALHLARDHGIQALVLEAGAIGWGASGRNAGFNTLPASKLSAKAVFQRWPEAEARAFFAAQREGQALIYQLAAEENFDLQACGNGIFKSPTRRVPTPNWPKKANNWPARESPIGCSAPASLPASAMAGRISLAPCTCSKVAASIRCN